MRSAAGSLNRCPLQSVFLFMHLLKTLTATAIAALVSTGCGTGSPAAEPATSSAPADGYVVKDYTFAPLTVAPGETVRVLDGDDEPHTLTAVDRSFDTGSFDKSEPGAFTAPNKPGTYDIFCEIHPSMRGTLTVR